MALISTTRGFIGKGPISIQVRGAATAPVEFGNCKSLMLKIETDRKARIDYQGAGGGELDVVERIKAMSGEVVVDDFKPANLALALRGAASTVASAAVADEALTLFPDSKAFFDFLPDPAQPVVVMVGAATLIEGTDYRRTRSGIEMIGAGVTATVAAGGTAAIVDYQKNAQYLIQALTDSGTEYLLVFDGLNEVDSGNPIVARLHRIKFSPTAGLDLIGDDFGELKMEFSVLKDDTIVTAGLSQYLQIAVV